MSDIQSCGFLLYRTEPNLSFLLMRHPTRWDLPKGHVDAGESERQCAVRELQEETGITEDQIDIDPDFRFQHDYDVSLARFNFEPRRKTLTVFLAKLNEPAFDIRVTEHTGYRWMPWAPPHQIQSFTIDPLLRAVEQHWQADRRR